MADALWIDEDYLMENSIINENTDMKVLTPNIVYVQDAYIKPLIGSRLFDIIQAEITAQVYTTRVTTLLNDYLKKVILNYVLSESVHDMSFRWTNKGMMQKNSDNSVPVNVEQLKSIQEKYKNRAEIFADRATNYILANLTTYTEYYNGTVNIDTILPKGKGYTTGIYLGRGDDSGLDSDRCDYIKRNV